jgi:hypothetical protein
MNEPDNHNIISLGNFRKYDPRFWGPRDHARAAAEDAELSSHAKQWFLPSNRQPVPDHVLAWQLTGMSAADEARQRAARVRRLEEKRGLRPRNGW